MGETAAAVDRAGGPVAPLAQHAVLRTRSSVASAEVHKRTTLLAVTRRGLVCRKEAHTRASTQATSATAFGPVGPEGGRALLSFAGLGSAGAILSESRARTTSRSRPLEHIAATGLSTLSARDRALRPGTPFGNDAVLRAGQQVAGLDIHVDGARATTIDGALSNRASAEHPATTAFGSALRPGTTTSHSRVRELVGRVGVGTELTTREERRS